MPALTSTRRVPILMYHSISSHATDRFKRFTVPSALFDEQVAYMQRNGYTSMTVTQYRNVITQGAMLPERPVILTFDDGFADFYSDALPVLRRYNFVATLYVTTSFVNGTSRWLRREGETERPMLNWDQLKEIAAYGIECGAHTHCHSQLDTLSASSAKMEIIQSKLLLEHQLGVQVESFAYPYGYYTARVKRQVKEAGYTSACAVKHAMSEVTGDPFILARQTVTAKTDINALEALLTGRNASLTKGMFARLSVPLWRWARHGAASFTRLFPVERQVVR